jgi:predicted enzyme related to lactoylglutathione lyase
LAFYTELFCFESAARSICYRLGINDRENSVAKVVGVGGVFFKSEDPEKLGAWYQKWLGVPVEPPYGATFRPDSVPSGGLTVWAPFTNDTDYFNPSTRDFMFNLMVDDLEGALAQVVEGGAEVVGEIMEESYGRFGWFVDPEGNKVELWEPREGL